ncbi:MAG TPA: TPM domain-containing protein [Candidatus Angelobacter sp.]|nr:TPM domain-containing protein [Candidatus Angelobacter sp.]
MVRFPYKLVAVALLLAAVAALAHAEKIADIQPQGYVTDLAGVINPATRQKIELLATEVEQKTGDQIAVVTVNSLEGQTREDYAADLYKHLGIGKKGKDNGVLILIAPKDRQYKIEIGYGLEPVINDARAGDVGRAMVPDLRTGDYSAAAWAGTTGVAQYIAADAGVQFTGMPQRAARPATHEAPWWLPFVLFGGFFLLVRALARSGRNRRPPPGGGGGMGSALPWLLLGNAMGRGGSSWGGGFGGSSGGWGGGGGGGFGGFGGGMSGSTDCG